MRRFMILIFIVLIGLPLVFASAPDRFESFTSSTSGCTATVPGTGTVNEEVQFQGDITASAARETGPSETSPPGDIAVNPSRTGFPHPLDSDSGWGGGADTWDIVDGIRTYSYWANGLAFTGGINSYGGPCGWRQATINFGEPKTFNKVLIWHHGLDHVPNTYKLQYWDGANWIDIMSTTTGHDYLVYPTAAPDDWWESWSTPTENTFPAVTSDKVRIELNNCDITHGWIYEFEVYLEQVFEWDFGDGSPHSYEQNPTHVYTSEGDYNWTMTVDLGDGTFCYQTGTITINPPAPVISVTFPNGGEVFELGSSLDITWTTTGTVGDVKIEYSTNNGTDWLEITPATENDGIHPWTVPGTVSANCLIRISETDGDPSDTSDAVFSIVPLPTLIVTSPNGGENWHIGTPHDITWATTGTVGNVKIEYSTDNGSSWTEVASSTANDGVYSWTVPNTVSSDCLIRIAEVDGSPVDTSDSVFEISYATSGCSAVVPGTGYVNEEIQFQGDIGESASLETGPSETSPPGDIAVNPSRTGFPHPLDSDNGWGGGADTWDIVDGIRTYSDWANGLAFTGGSLPYVEPCGWRQATINFGELKTFNKVLIWHHGLEHVPNTYKLQYWDGADWIDIMSTTSGHDYLVYPTAAPDDWWESWSTPTENTFPAVTSDNVRIELNNCDITHGWIYEFEVYMDQVFEWDFGDGSPPSYEQNPTHVYTAEGTYTWTMLLNDGGTFCQKTGAITITQPPPPPSITVTAPNGGESWEVGTVHDITWTTTGTIDQVNIEYSTAGYSGTYISIAESIANSGSYQWTVPDGDSNQCVVRVGDVSGTPADTSDGLFTITPAPSITITTPNGGELWKMGTPQDIIWTFQDVTGDVIIRLYKNNSLHREIGTAPVSDGSFNWNIPGDLSAGTNYQVRISQGSIEDYSDNNFSIVSLSPFRAFPDFNTDGQADILWRYQGPEGYNAVWLLGTNGSAAAALQDHANNPGVVHSYMYSIPWKNSREQTGPAMFKSNQPYKRDGFGDVNDWENAPGAFERFRIDENQLLSDFSRAMSAPVSDPRDDPQGVELISVADQNWKLAATGDFDRDGKVDIIWSHVGDGRNCVWYMDGTTFAGHEPLPDGASTDWVLAGVGDFNQDNKPDLIWRNEADGRNAVWYMDGTTLLSIGIMTTGANLDWKLCGTGDFNSDDKVDLVWRNTSDGRNAVWYMDGAELSSVGWLTSVEDQNWKLRGTGDFNSDGKTDLTWTDVSDGRNCIWYLDGVTLTGVEFLTTVTVTDWKIVN